MGAAVGTDDGDSVNVELNVVPFIDLMSCLTAFLLVTAVWSEYSQINIKPKGISRDSSKVPPEETPTKISVLLTKSEILVGLTTGARLSIPNEGEMYDWATLEEELLEYRKLPEFSVEPLRVDIEVAAEDDVVYQALISAMDSAIHASFEDVGYAEPNSLSVKFKE